MNHSHPGHAEWQAIIGKRRVRSAHERAVEAESNVARFLADANEAREAGRQAQANRLDASAQRWLDRYNTLKGRGAA